MVAIDELERKIPVIDASDFDRLRRLSGVLRSALLGKADKTDLVLTCLLAQGHLLLDDLPGTGKTTLAKALASSLGGRFARIQCTPDLLPTDITGFTLYNQKTHEFEFHSGPVFSDVLLADELNRTTPRTQSALLEAMAERQVTIDSEARPLTDTFFVIATQNPIDSHGSYPLPEAQLDRFSIRLEIGYPNRDAQLAMLERAVSEAEVEDAPRSKEQVVMPLDVLHRLQTKVAMTKVHPTVREYLVDLVEATRQHGSVELGVSPRGMLIWQRMAQAWAVLHERDFVSPTDVQDVGPHVLSVRMIVRGGRLDKVVQEIFEQVPVPDYR